MDFAGEYAEFSPAEIIKERDELRRALQDARQEIAAQKTQAELTQQEGEAMQRKLRTLADDMQTRLGLGQKQDSKGELAAAEGEIIRLKRQVKDSQSRVDELQQTSSKLENESITIKEELKSNDEILRLKEALRESEKREKMFESELVERRHDEENRKLISDDGGNDPLKDCYNSFTSAQSISETKEKILRLEIENKYLNEQIKELQSSAAGEQTASEDESALKASIHRLKEELKKSEFEREKVSREKANLEAYTKKTLAKFQEKYLVALQECKAKLKEKHNKIEQLENLLHYRSAA